MKKQFSILAATAMLASLASVASAAVDGTLNMAGKMTYEVEYRNNGSTGWWSNNVQSEGGLTGDQVLELKWSKAATTTSPTMDITYKITGPLSYNNGSATVVNVKDGSGADFKDANGKPYNVSVPANMVMRHYVTFTGSLGNGVTAKLGYVKADLDGGWITGSNNEGRGAAFNVVLGKAGTLGGVTADALYLENWQNPVLAAEGAKVKLDLDARGSNAYVEYISDPLATVGAYGAYGKYVLPGTLGSVEAKYAKSINVTNGVTPSVVMGKATLTPMTGLSLNARVYNLDGNKITLNSDSSYAYTYFAPTLTNVEGSVKVSDPKWDNAPWMNKVFLNGVTVKLDGSYDIKDKASVTITKPYFDAVYDADRAYKHLKVGATYPAVYLTDAYVRYQDGYDQVTDHMLNMAKEQFGKDSLKGEKYTEAGATFSKTIKELADTTLTGYVGYRIYTNESANATSAYIRAQKTFGGWFTPQINLVKDFEYYPYASGTTYNTKPVAYNEMVKTDPYLKLYLKAEYSF